MKHVFVDMHEWWWNVHVHRLLCTSRMSYAMIHCHDSSRIRYPDLCHADTAWSTRWRALGLRDHKACVAWHRGDPWWKSAGHRLGQDLKSSKHLGIVWFSIKRISIAIPGFLFAILSMMKHWTIHAFFMIKHVCSLFITIPDQLLLDELLLLISDTNQSW